MADRNDIDGAGIVSCGKRLSISLVFHSLNCSSSASSRGCNLYIVCLYVCEWGLSWDGEQWSMRVNYDDRSFYASSIVTT